MDKWLSAFCAGVIILYCFAVLLPWWFFIFATVFCLAALPPRKDLFCVFFLLGWAYANTFASAHSNRILPLEWEGSVLKVAGQICSLVRVYETYQRFDLCVDSITLPDQSVLIGSRKIALTGTLTEDFSHYDRSIELLVKLKRPRSVLNPAGLPFEQILFANRIVAKGSVSKLVAWGEPYRLSLSMLRGPWLELRQTWIQHIGHIVGSLEHGGIFLALLSGERMALSEGDRMALRDTGTQHLMAISGLHVGMIAILIWRLLPHSLAGWLGLGGITFFYVMLVGLPASAMRAWLMVMVLSLGQIGRLSIPWYSSLLWAASMLLLWDPLLPLNPGFVYSFVSVATLIVLLRSRVLNHQHVWKAMLLSQVTFLLVLLPINAVYGAPHNGVSLLANMVAIPLVSWIVLPGLVLASLLALVAEGWGQSVIEVVHEVTHFMMAYLSALSVWPLSANLDISWPRLVPYMVVLVSLPWRIFPRVSVLVLLTCLGVAAFWQNENAGRPTSLRVLDVGQGLSLLIQTEEVRYLYDLGAAHGSFAHYSSAAAPLLRSEGGEHVSGLIISHADNDHAGGASWVVPRLKPNILWSGEVGRLGVSGFESCLAGQQLHHAGLTIEVLYPFVEQMDRSSNNHSCVLVVTLAGRRFLLMGDLEGSAERELVRHYGSALKADVLIAGHHGSNNASRLTLLKHVLPSTVVFSAGYRNRFGHPHKDVLARVQSIGAKSLNTADLGAISFHLKEGEWGLSYTRQTRQAFWLDAYDR